MGGMKEFKKQIPFKKGDKVIASNNNLTWHVCTFQDYDGRYICEQKGWTKLTPDMDISNNSILEFKYCKKWDE